MAILNWDQDTERLYETGVDRGVVYPYNSTSKSYPAGYAWNGLTGVDESPSGAEETALWADNDKYLSLRSKEEFGGTPEPGQVYVADSTNMSTSHYRSLIFIRDTDLFCC